MARTKRNTVRLATGTAEKPVSLFIPMALAVDELDVDAEKGILRNVSFIARGPAIGHSAYVGDERLPMVVDDQTLQQVFESLKAKTKGVKSRLAHPFLEDGIVARLGRANVKKVDTAAGKVRGDINLGTYSKSTPKGDLWSYVMGLATEDAESIGLSIVFDPAPSEKQITDDGIAVAAVRVSNVLAVDVVDDPAANPDGLFGRGDGPAGNPTDGDSLMNPELKKHLIETCGLKADATDAEALTFMFELPKDKRAKAIQMMSVAPVPVPVEPPAPAPELAAPPAPDPVNALAIATAERTRIAAIQQLGTQYKLSAAWAQGQIDALVPFEAAKLAGLELFAQTRAPVATVGDDLNVESLGVSMSDALCLRAGVPIFDREATVDKLRLRGRRARKILEPDEEILVTREPHARSREFRSMTLIEMGRSYLRSLGVVGVDSFSRPRIAELMLNKQERMNVLGYAVAFAQSTADFDELLADVLGKSLLAAYAQADMTWNLVFRRTTAPDFKSLKFIKLSESPDLTILPEGAPITFGILGDEQETVALATYGKALQLTRQAMINDDLNAFERIPALHGAAAARLEDDVVWAILNANPNMADGNALFSAAHANLAIGVGEVGAPTVALLDVANASFRTQTGFAPGGVAGATLNLRPRTIMVPAALDGTTSQLLNSTADPVGINSGVANRWNTSALRQVTESRLDGGSATAWYLACEPGQADTIVVVFLEGEEVPVLSEETIFGTGDKRFAVRHTVAAKAVDHRGLYQNPGV